MYRHYGTWNQSLDRCLADRTSSQMEEEIQQSLRRIQFGRLIIKRPHNAQNKVQNPKEKMHHLYIRPGSPSLG